MIEVRLTALEFVQGTSDKFYRVFVVGSAVVTQYGRNGTYGTFTSAKDAGSPIAAVNAASKAVAAKTAKGYVLTATAGTSFAADPSRADLDRWASNVPSGGIEYVAGPQLQILPAVSAEPDPEPAPAPRPKAPFPMLAHNAEPAQIERMLDDPRWVVQPKLDGNRVLVEVWDGDVRVYNRNGQPKVSNVGADLLEPFKAFAEGHWVFDGEVVGRELWLFDLPVAGRRLDSKAPFAERYAVLDQMVWALSSDLIRLVGLAETSEDKRAMLAAAKAGSKEGVMFRLRSSRYTAGRSTELLKHKFVKTIDCVVIETGRDGKENAYLAVYDHAGRLVQVGKASTIGKNKAGGGIKVGQVVEVTFLYIVDPADPHLYQPRIVRVRTDKPAEACSVDQLIGAVTDRTVA